MAPEKARCRCVKTVAFPLTLGVPSARSVQARPNKRLCFVRSRWRRGGTPVVRLRWPSFGLSQDDVVSSQRIKRARKDHRFSGGEGGHLGEVLGLGGWACWSLGVERWRRRRRWRDGGRKYMGISKGKILFFYSQLQQTVICSIFTPHPPHEAHWGLGGVCNIWGHFSDYCLREKR